MKLFLQTYSLHLSFGLHSDCYHYPDKLKLEDCIRLAKKWRFAGVQIDPVHLEHDTKEYARNLKRIADTEHLILELGVEGFNRDHIKNNLYLAESMGVKFIRVFEVVGTRPNNPAEIQNKLEAICTEIDSIIPDLERFGIVLGWENHADYSTMEQLYVLKKINHPNFQSCIDIGNSMIFLESPLDTVKNLLPFSGGVHFKDYAITGTTFGFKFYGTALGTGVIPLKEVTKILTEKSMLDHVVYEQSIEPKSNDPKESILFEEKTIIESINYAHNELGFTIG